MKLLVIVLVLLARRQSFAAAEFQVEALYEMKQLMDDNNEVLSDWKDNQMSPCYWDHVTCEDNKVTTINLASFGLRGALSPSIAKIATLQQLLLDSNRITGQIPQGFHNLSCLTTLQLGRNNLNGSIPNSLGSLLKLQNLSLEENYIFGEIPPELGNLSSLVNLNLGRNDLSGSIPDFLGNLKKLQELDLRGNRLTGNIPSTLAGLQSLNYINLAYNNLIGEIPVQLLHVAQYDFTGNSLLNCGNESIPCAKPNPNAGRSSKGWVIAIVISLVVALICLILFLGWIRRKRKGKWSLNGTLKVNLHQELGIEGSNSNFTIFDFPQVLQATKGFSVDNKLGQGGFGPVYKGQLPDGLDIAVKRLASHSGQGFREFKNEVQLIAKTETAYATGVDGFLDVADDERSRRH